MNKLSVSISWGKKSHRPCDIQDTWGANTTICGPELVANGEVKVRT